MRIPLVLSLCLLAGCNAWHHTPPEAFYPPTTDPTLELSNDSTILLSEPQNWERMTLHGFHLGDDAATINPKLITDSDKGWDTLLDGNRLHIGDDGKINAFGLREVHTLNQLDIDAAGDIQKQFGKPQHIIKTSDTTVYLYQDQHIHVVWRTAEHGVEDVNVVKQKIEDNVD